MAFWNRRSVNTGTNDDEIYRSPGRHWPALLIYLLIALIIATGVVYAGRWAYRKATTPENPVPTITQKTETDSAAKKPETEKKTSSSSSGSDTDNSADEQTSQSESLPKSGPANVLMLFLGTTFAATALHYAIAAKRNY